MTDRIEKALIVADPWISLILDGKKDWEMRSRKTAIRGNIGLIRKGSGLVCGVVKLVGCGEADAFCSPEEQSYYRAILFNEIANASAKSTKAQRKLLGRALAHSETAKSLRRYVEVAHEDDIFDFSDEDDQEVDNSADEADADNDEIYLRDLLPTVIDNKLAGTDRKDAEQLIPRPRPKKHQQVKTWAESERAKNRGVPSSRRGQGQDHQIVRKQKPRRAGGMNIKWEAQR
jgi:hypothetical protein